MMSLTLMSWNWPDFKISTLFVSSKTIKEDHYTRGGPLHKGILTDRKTGSDVFVTLWMSERMESCWNAQRPAVLIIYFFELSAVLDKDQVGLKPVNISALWTPNCWREREREREMPQAASLRFTAFACNLMGITTEQIFEYYDRVL